MVFLLFYPSETGLGTKWPDWDIELFDCSLESPFIQKMKTLVIEKDDSSKKPWFVSIPSSVLSRPLRCQMHVSPVQLPQEALILPSSGCFAIN
jgi:hypothetical protein